jgi:predicted RNA-binding Zn-ribbon protein involved in translation (DUF1610 family)
MNLPLSVILAWARSQLRPVQQSKAFEYCPNCNSYVWAEQAERDEVCLYVCPVCGTETEDRLPF